MLSCRALLILPLIAGTFFWADIQPGSSAQVRSSEEELRLTRVFYLQGMEKREAVTLLRSQLQVRQIAEVQGSDIVIVTEAAEKVERCENLLRELDAVARAVAG
jgi:type II secretory pathway component GspD/PulD (secretin)